MKIDSIYQKIGSCIKQIAASKENHVHCPAKDFTRSRKISFSDCLMSVLMPFTIFYPILIRTPWYRTDSNLPNMKR